MLRAMCLLTILLAADQLYADDPRRWGAQGLPIRGEAPVTIAASASDPGGRTIIVWVDDEVGRGDIHAQLVDAGGAPLWGDSGRVLVGSLESDYSPVVRANNGVFTLFWSKDDGSDWSGDELWAQRFDLLGDSIWPQNDGLGVIVSGVSGSRLGTFRVTSDGEVCVTYYVWDFYGEQFEYYLQRIDVDGNVMWPTPVTLVTDGDLGMGISVAFNEDGSLYLARSIEEGLYSAQFHLTKLSSDGSVAWGPVTIAEPDSSSGAMGVLSDGSGGCYFAWSGSLPGTREMLRMQRYDAEGDSVWLGGPISIDSCWARGYYLTLLFDESNGDTAGVIAVWDDEYMFPDSGHVNAQKISENGEQSWLPAGRQLCYNGVTRSTSTVLSASDHEGGVVCLIRPYMWNGQHYRRPLFATRLNAAGLAAWGNPYGMVMADEVDSPSNPVVSVDWNGAAILSWNEKSNECEARTQRVDIATGQFLAPVEGEVWAHGLQGFAGNATALALPDGRAAVVWNDTRAGFYTADALYYQIVNMSGESPLVQHGVPLTISTDSSYNDGSSEFDLCSDGQGGFFVMFPSSREQGVCLMAARVNSQGEPVGDPAGTFVAQGTGVTISNVEPRCVPDGDGGAYVVWNRRISSDNYEIVVQLINSNLEMVWPDPLVLSQSNFSFDFDDVAATSDGACVVVWTESGIYETVHAVKVLESYGVAWNVAVCDSAYAMDNATVACDAAGDVYVAWVDWRFGWQQPAGVYGQKLNSAGVLQLPLRGIPLTTDPDAESPDLCTNAQGEPFLTWKRNLAFPECHDLVLKYSTMFEPLWPEEGVQLSTGIVSEFRHAAALPDNEGGILAAWTEIDPSFEQSAARGKHLNSSGAVTDEYWDDAHGGVICDTLGSQWGPALAPGMNPGEFFCFWTDNRTASQIYGQFIDEDTTDQAVPPPVVHEFRLEQNYPNPFNAETRFIFELPQAGRVALELYNVLGQKAATVVDEIMTSGRHETAFDASHLSSGLYIYRLTAGSHSTQRKLVLLK